MSVKRAAGLLCLCATSCTFPDAPRTAPSSGPPPTTRPLKGGSEGLQVPITDLFEAYEKNAQEANEKYKDRLLILRDCTIRGVSAFEEPPFIDLYVPLGMGASVRCWFTSQDRDALATYKLGGNIAVKGRCIGAVNNLVTLEGCTVLRYRPQN